MVKLTFKEIFRKKDFYVALILVGVILLFASRMEFYEVGNVSRYLSEMGLALIYLFSAILIVPLAARQVPSEVRDRTLAVMLAKPLSRAQFVFGKFLGSALAGVACFVVFFGAFLAVTIAHGALPDARTAASLFQGAALFSVSLCVLAAMATGLSFYMTMSANISLTLVIFLLMTSYGAQIRHSLEDASAISRMAGDVVYFALPHFEFFDLRQRMIHQWGPIRWDAFFAAVAYGGAFVGVFLVAGYARFRRRML